MKKKDKLQKYYGSTQDYKVSVTSDEIIETTIGNFGRWQARVSILMSLLKFPITWIQLGIVFLAPPTEFWCKQPEDWKWMKIDEWKHFISPKLNGSHHHIGLQSGSCIMRNLDLPHSTNAVMPCRWGYDYNRTTVTSSIITEWNLVCGKERLVDLAQIVLMFGILLGNIIFGVLADRYGRKKILISCIVIQSFGGILSAWSPWYEGFLVCRFLLAIANGGTMIVSFVMCMEVVGGKWRTIVGILYQIPFGIGNAMMAILAYFIRDWRYLQLTLSGISSVYIFYFWFVPESPRWLIATGRKEDAIAVLEKAARMNRMDPKKVRPAFAGYTIPEDNKPKLKALLSTRTLRRRTLLLCVNWLICGFSFYAFSQYLGLVSSNIYLTVAVGGLVSIPGTLICMILVRRCGRKIPLVTAHFFTSICFFSIMLVPKGMFKSDWPRVGFAALGVIGLSISLPTLCLFTGELFPTVVRNAGVGSSVMSSKIGSMLAPLLIALSDVYEFLPLTILGIIAIIEGLLVLPLPETKDMVLPETIEDVDSPKMDLNKNEISREQGIEMEPLRPNFDKNASREETEG